MFDYFRRINSYPRDWCVKGVSSKYHHFHVYVYSKCHPFCPSSCLLLASDSIPSHMRPFESAMLSPSYLLFTQSKQSPLTRHPTSSFGTRSFGSQTRQHRLLWAAFCLLKGWPNCLSCAPITPVLLPYSREHTTNQHK